MRNIFKKSIVAETSESVMDMQPRGVHHTVSYRGEFNETWKHLRDEVRNTTLPDPKELYVESRDIYSYDVKVSSPKLCAPQKINTVNKTAEQHCNVMKLTGGLFSSANTAAQEEEVVESKVETGKDESSVSQITSTFESEIIEYALESTEKASQEYAISTNYHYEITIGESLVYSFCEGISATSDYGSKKYVSTTQNTAQESGKDISLVEQIVLESFLPVSPKASAYSGFRGKSDFSGRPQNQRAKNRHRPEKLAKRLQNRSMKDRHVTGKPTNNQQNQKWKGWYREEVFVQTTVS
uniref:Uncharacterized protein n=1 Tax=Roseihalotalea indica TaxID=2867963 RepID=A0AA49GTD8_9BACT|nr:hypothetical protein K4G66_00640 [Tunicatimonas sp. TK19036]